MLLTYYRTIRPTATRQTTWHHTITGCASEGVALPGPLLAATISARRTIDVTYNKDRAKSLSLFLWKIKNITPSCFFNNDFRRSIQPKLFGAAVFKARMPFTDQRLTARHRQESSRAEWLSCNGLPSTVTDHVSSRTCLGYAKTADMLAWKHPRNRTPRGFAQIIGPYSTDVCFNGSHTSRQPAAPVEYT